METPPVHLAFLSWKRHQDVAAMFGRCNRWVVDRIKAGEFGTSSEEVIQDGNDYLVSCFGLRRFVASRAVFSDSGAFMARSPGVARRKAAA